MNMKANMDIREYMEDHGVTQAMLGIQLGVHPSIISRMLKFELSQKEKDDLLRNIDAIVDDSHNTADEAVTEEPEASPTEEAGETENPEENVTKFQIGDRVKIPSKQLTIGIISDIWLSKAQKFALYSVKTEDGRVCLYEEKQLEPAPIPIEYTFGAYIDGNVAVVVMNATQGDKTWVHARGHAHVIHDGAVGFAQAISFAAKRMFETLDTKTENRIYFKDGGNK